MAGLEDIDDVIGGAAESSGRLSQNLADAYDAADKLVDEATNYSDIMNKVKSAGFLLADGFIELAKEINFAEAASFLFFKTLMDIRDQTQDVVSEFGQTKYFADGLESSLINVNTAVFDLDVDSKEILDTYIGFTNEMGKLVMLTDKQAERMIVLSKATGLSTQEMGKMVAEMSDLGMGTTMAIQNLESMAVEAQRMGLNVNTFIGNIGQNIKLVNQYGFDKGINGLAKMVAKAQSLRFDIQQAVNIADGILDGGPEKAVELAAELATLGGDIGELGDPFALMYNSLNDVGSIQDSLVELASAAASVNEETGQLEIPTYARERLRQQAKLLGVPFEQLTAAAINSKKQMMALEEIEFSGLAGMSDEDKEFIANMSQINEQGEMVVTLREGDTTREIKLTDEDGIRGAMDALRKQQKEDSEDPQDTLRKNTEAMVSLKDTLATLGSKEALIKLGAGTFGSETIKTMMDGLTQNVTNLKGTLSEYSGKLGEEFKQPGGPTSKGVKDIALGLGDELVTQAGNFGKTIGLTDEAINKFKTAISGAADELSKIDLSNFRKKENLNSDEPNQASEEQISNLSSEEPRQAVAGEVKQDFIMRPGEEPVSFDKGDIILGGTNLFDNKTAQYEPINNLVSILSTYVDNLSRMQTVSESPSQTSGGRAPMKDININVGGTISLNDRYGNSMDLLKNPDARNEIVSLVKTAFERGYDQFGS
jgi:hypothetical protein